MALTPMMESMAHDCVVLDRRTIPDGEGGYTIGYADGAAFRCYPSLDSSMQARKAEKEGVTSLYTVLILQNVPLQVGDVYKDTTEGAYFRVTSRPDEKHTPATSQLDLKAFAAEKLEALPT